MRRAVNLPDSQATQDADIASSMARDFSARYAQIISSHQTPARGHAASWFIRFHRYAAASHFRVNRRIRCMPLYGMNEIVRPDGISEPGTVIAERLFS